MSCVDPLPKSINVYFLCISYFVYIDALTQEPATDETLQILQHCM